MSPTAVESWKAHDTPNIAASWIVAMWVEGAWRFVTFEVEAAHVIYTQFAGVIGRRKTRSDATDPVVAYLRRCNPHGKLRRNQNRA